VNIMNRKTTFFIFVTALMVSCYPSGPETVDELDLVLTTHEAAFNFGAANTFALPSKIPEITGNIVAGDPPEFLNDAQAKQVLDRIRQNMIARGYTEVQTNADLVIPVAVMSTTTLVYYCDYWWNYWGWWGYYPIYPGYGGCYYPSGYAYTTGTVLISMIDDAHEDGKPETAVNGVWAAAINGLLDGSDASTSARVDKGIDQAFAQSVYINTK